jgi:hypothetical protein
MFHPSLVMSCSLYIPIRRAALIAAAVTGGVFVEAAA